MSRNQIASIIADLTKDYIANYGSADAEKLASSYWEVRHRYEEDRDKRAGVTIEDYTQWVSSVINDAKN
jgi:hypothetical protein